MEVIVFLGKQPPLPLKIFFFFYIMFSRVHRLYRCIVWFYLCLPWSYCNRQQIKLTATLTFLEIFGIKNILRSCRFQTLLWWSVTYYVFKRTMSLSIQNNFLSTANLQDCCLLLTQLNIYSNFLLFIWSWLNTPDSLDSCAVDLGQLCIKTNIYILQLK